MLRIEAGFEIVRRAAGGEVMVVAVADLPRRSDAEEIAEDVAAGHQGVARGEPFRRAGGVGRLLERMLDVARERGVFAAGAEADGVVFADLLDGRKVERTVANHRSAGSRAELVARVVGFRRIEIALGAKRLVAEERERIAVNVVRS